MLKKKNYLNWMNPEIFDRWYDLIKFGRDRKPGKNINNSSTLS